MCLEGMVSIPWLIPVVGRLLRCWFCLLWYLHDQSLQKCRSKILMFVWPVKVIRRNPVYYMNTVPGSPYPGVTAKHLLFLWPVRNSGSSEDKRKQVMYTLSPSAFRTCFPGWHAFPLCKHYKSFQRAVLIRISAMLWHLLLVKAFFASAKAPVFYEYLFFFFPIITWGTVKVTTWWI